MVIDLRSMAFPETAGEPNVQPVTLTFLFDEIMARTGYTAHISDISDTPDQLTDRMENLRALRGLLDSKKDLALNEFLADVSLSTDADTTEEVDKGNSVTLLTLHAAKGLEYPIVFITGVEDGLLPHSRSFSDPDEMAEERRLLYVGLTRAEHQLYLTYAFRRSLYGESIPSIPSRFLGDIPAELTEGAPLKIKHMGERQAYSEMTRWESARESGSDGGDSFTRRSSGGSSGGKIISFENAAAAQSARRAATTLKYKPGQRVYHAKFGEGVVLDSHRFGEDEEVTINFEEFGQKRLAASFANLRILDN
jgi:DNA helicase-2/ATP-dependent DNA helicase PcrA